MSRQGFNTVDVLRLEVENTPTGPTNAIQNPSGELGAWGWVTPVYGSSMQAFPITVANAAGPTWLQFTPVPGVANYFYSEPFRVRPGQYVVTNWLQMWWRYRSWLQPSIEWLNTDGTVIGSGGTGPNQSSGSDLTAISGFLTSSPAPSTTTRARLRFDLYATYSGGNPNEQHYLQRVNAAVADQPAANVIAPVTYTNVLGPTHSLTIDRDELNVGTLTAVTLDASLDPSQNDLIRPGKRCRVMVLADTGAWEPIFTGKISRGTTTYDASRTDPKRATITLTALDAASPLAQVSRPEGVAEIVELPYVLEGAGVPWNVNGYQGQSPTASVTSTTDSATAVDQVAMTRDSNLGYAWVDRSWSASGLGPRPAGLDCDGGAR